VLIILMVESRAGATNAPIHERIYFATGVVHARIYALGSAVTVWQGDNPPA